MNFEEIARSAVRWHGSFVNSNQTLKTVLKDTQGYNKNVLESEDESVFQITKAHEKRLSSAKLDTEEMTLRYAIQTLEDTDRDFTIENLNRRLENNLYKQSMEKP